MERVPASGFYYRFYNTIIGKYISTDASMPQTYSIKDAEPQTIFYYDKSALLSYTRGQYLQGAELADVGENGSEITIMPCLTGVSDMYNIISDANDYIRINTSDTVANTTGSSSTAGKAKAYDFRRVHVISLPVRLGDSGWTTFSAALPVTVPEGCVAYVVDGYESSTASVSLRSITPGTTIAANTGILLQGTPSTTVELAISETGSAYTDNLLRPAVPATSLDEDTKAYTLIYNNGILSFRQMSETNRMLPSHSSWLYVDDSTSPQSISIILPGGETSIKDIDADANGNGAIYNIHGQSLRKPQSGINIIDGRKVVVK